MPSIRISDHLNVEVLSAEAGPGSGISKYFKGERVGFIAGTELVNARNKSIATLTTAPLGFGLSFQKGGTFGSSEVEWSIQAGATATVDATQSGNAIPGEALFGSPIQVEPGRTFVSIAFAPMLSITLSTGAGDLQFGFFAGGSVEFRAGRSYDVTATPPTLGESLIDLYSTAVVPGDLADLKQMKAGDVASVSGTGKLRVSASFDIAKAMNPLATPTLGLEAIGALKLEGGASLTVGASIGISGRYQMRVTKVDDHTVRLGVYKMKGSQFQFDVKASAGISASLGKRELIETLMGMLGAPKADVVELVDAGLSDEQIADIKHAIEASLSRSLELSLAGSFATANTSSSVFEYLFDLSLLGADGSEALHRALEADLSVLTSLRSNQLPAGVKLVQSEIDNFQKKSTTWKINFLGLVNVLHVTTLVKSGKVLFDPDTGELLVTDSATAKEVFVKTLPTAADPQKLRKVMLKSAVLTAAYRATGVQKFLGLKGSLSHFEQTSSANRQTISDYLDNLMALLLITQAEKDAFLRGSFAGRASVLAEVQFDDTAFEGMFKDPAGKPWEQDHYDAIGRQCVLHLVQPGDPNDFRRIPMEPGNDQLWKEMTGLGPFNLHAVLPTSINSGVPLNLIIHDYVVIRWWSQAMSVAAEKVTDMRTFLAANGDDAEALKDNHEFNKRRADLANSLTKVVKQSEPDWLDAWGVVAMHTAAQRLGDVRGIVLTAGPVLARSRTTSLQANAAGQS